MVTRYYKKFLGFKKGQVDGKTITNLEQTETWLKDFESKYGTITFSMIDMIFYKSFNEYADSRGCAPATFGKHIEHIKSFMEWARTLNPPLHDNRYYIKMPVKRGRSKDQALTMKELKMLWEAQFPLKDVIDRISHYQKARFPYQSMKLKRYYDFLTSKDFFYAMCSSGTYMNDLLSLRKDNVKDGLVTYERYKGRHCQHNLCTFEYHDDDVFKFVHLSGLYNFHFVKHWNTGIDVKVMMDLLGIDKHITTKSGRKTYASILFYEMNAPDSLVMSALGHTKWESTRHYLCMDINAIKNQYKKLRQLNGTLAKN